MAYIKKSINEYTTIRDSDSKATIQWNNILGKSVIYEDKRSNNVFTRKLEDVLVFDGILRLKFANIEYWIEAHHLNILYILEKEPEKEEPKKKDTSDMDALRELFKKQIEDSKKALPREKNPWDRFPPYNPYSPCYPPYNPPPTRPQYPWETTPIICHGNICGVNSITLG